MGSLNPFSKPKIPTYVPPAPVVEPKPVAVPTAENSAKDTAAAELADQQRRKTQKGRAATILSSPTAQSTTGQSVAARSLMGS